MFLHFPVLGLLLLEGRVIACIQLGASPLNIQHLLHDPVQEIPVVRHHQDGFAVIPQIVLQPPEGCRVQMVGGLVQNQYVRGFVQNSRQSQPCFLPPGQNAAGRIHLLFRKAQGSENSLDPPLILIAAQLQKALVKAVIA